jgi:hypothetical protein
MWETYLRIKTKSFYGSLFADPVETHVEMYLLIFKVLKYHSRVQSKIVPQLQNAWISEEVDSLHSVHTDNFCPTKSKNLTELFL